MYLIIIIIYLLLTVSVCVLTVSLPSISFYSFSLGNFFIIFFSYFHIHRGNSIEQQFYSSSLVLHKLLSPCSYSVPFLGVTFSKWSYISPTSLSFNYTLLACPIPYFLPLSAFHPFRPEYLLGLAQPPYSCLLYTSRCV